jgi:Tfp pilus assembly protein PilF
MSQHEDQQHNIQEVTKLVQQNRLADALDKIEKMSDESGKQAELDYLKAMILLKQGKDEEAHKELQYCVEQHPDYAPALINLSVLTWKAGDHQTAMSQAEKAVKQDWANGQALQNYLDMLMHQKKKEKALEVIRQALALQENRPELLQLAAAIHLERQESVKAKYYIDLGKHHAPDQGVWKQLETMV